jgi:O-antigen/teichoic acid export membrane protein
MQSLLSRLKRPRIASFACAILLCVLPITLYATVTLGPYTLLPVDNLYQWQPFKSSASKLGIGLPQNELLSDLILQNYPWKQFIITSLRNGELPLWNPNLFAGVPFLAAGQHSALYPFSLLYYALPLEKAFGWFTVTQMAIAGVCMFAFMRTLGMRRYSSVFAGVAFQFSGIMAVSVVHPMILAAVAWLPLVLAMCEKVIQQAPALNNRPSSMPWVVIGALSVALVVLAGHVEVLIYTLMTATLFSLWRIGTVIGFRNLRVDGKYLVGRVVWLVIMGTAGLALGAVQLLPLFELVTRNFREGRSTYEQVIGYAFPIRYVFQWLMPNVFGNPAHHTYFDLFTFSTQAVNSPSGNTAWGIKNYVEGGVYIGIVSLVFAGVAMVSTIYSAIKRQPSNVKRKTSLPTWFFIALAVVSVLFIFGTPLYAVLFFGVPGFNQLHTPFRWSIPMTVCLAALAGIGLELLATEVKARMPMVGAYRPKIAPAGPKPSRPQVIGSAATMAIGALLIVAVVVVRLAYPAFAPLFDQFVQGDLVRQGFTSGQMFFSYQARNIVGLGLALIGTGLVWWLLIRRKTQDASTPPTLYTRLLHTAPALAIALLVIDLNLAWSGFVPSVNPALLQHTPEAVTFLQQDPSLHRITAYEPSGTNSFKPFEANSGWLYGIQDVRGYDSIIPKQYTDYMRAIEPQGGLLYNRVQPIKNPQSLDSPLLDLLGVKYVITDQTIDTAASPGYKSVFDDGATRIYENTRALPRAYTMPMSSTVVADPTTSFPSYSAWFANASQQFDPRKWVLADTDLPCRVDANCPTPTEAQFTPATITSYKNTEVWVDAQINGPSWLILNDSYFPGWRAFVRPLGATESNEREVPIVRVNGNFRGVQLINAQASTAYTIRFRYIPDSFRLGAFTTFIALTGVLFLGGIYVWRNWPRSEKSATGVHLVARNSLVLTGLNMGARLIDFVFALLMLRLLGPEGAGYYYFAVVIVGWFEILMNFGLNTFLTREISRDRANAHTYLAQTSRLRLLLALGVAPLLILVVVLWRVFGGLSVEAEIAIALLAISQIPSSLATGLSALFFAYERAEVPAALTIVSALLKAAIGTVLLLLGWGVVGLGITSIVVNLITLVMLFVLARRIFDFRLTIADFKQPALRLSKGQSSILRESFPLMLNHLLATLFFKVDVPLLQALKGASVVGVYSAAYKFIDAFNIVPAFFTQSLFPAMSRMALQRDQSLSRSYVLALKLLVMTSLPLAVATAFLAVPMVGILGGAEFLPDGAIALAIMAWSMPIGWINSVTNYALIAANKQHALTRAFIIGLGFNIVANIILIPMFSFVAAAVVTIFSEIVEGAAFYVYVHRHIAPVNWVDVLARPFLAAGIMAAITYGFYAMGLVLIGVLVGAASYVGVLWLLRALDGDERAILRPLVKRGA